METYKAYLNGVELTGDYKISIDEYRNTIDFECCQVELPEPTRERVLEARCKNIEREDKILREKLERLEKEYTVKFLENYLSELKKLRDKVIIEDLSSDETRIDIFACILNNMSRVECDIKKLKEELK